MGVEPPFIYDKPSTYTFAGPTSQVFNPRAATQASWSPKPPKIKQDGPLLNFNRHPDSYIQAPYGQLSFQRMPANTRTRAVKAWKAQRVFRSSGLLTAVGAVFCVIAIKNTTTVSAWIIRVGPIVALCHMLYAVYFFCRGVNSRPPTSCASYQMFAGLLDVGLIPFFAFSGYMAWTDYKNNTYGWSTLFHDNIIDYKIIQSTFIICAVMLVLLFASLAVDVYLAKIFRQIAQLPPDANPLDDKDNLTARPRHKRNKSDLLHEKHMSNSTVASERFSQQVQSQIAGRRVPYAHSRTDSQDTVTSFKATKDMLGEMGSPQVTRANPYQTPPGSPLRPSSAVMPSPNSRQAGAGLSHKPSRSTQLRNNTVSPDPRPNSWLSYSNYEGIPTQINDYAEQENERRMNTMSPVSAMSNGENYHIHEEREPSPEPDYMPVYQPPQSSLPQQHEAQNMLAPPLYTSQKKRSRDPLGMNPPTPIQPQHELYPPASMQHQYSHEELAPRPLSVSSTGQRTPQRQILRETINGSATSVPVAATPGDHFGTPSSRPASLARPASFIGSGGKNRFYGNLRTSIGGVTSNSPSPTRSTYHGVEDQDLYRSDTVKTADSGNFEVYDTEDSADEEFDAYHRRRAEIQEAQAQTMTRHSQEDIKQLTPNQWQSRSQRQISSSTGFDLHQGYAGLGEEFGKGMARRREVSGKAAEEGRSYDVFDTREINRGHHPPRQAAAGWARFKGL